MDPLVGEVWEFIKDGSVVLVLDARRDRRSAFWLLDTEFGRLTGRVNWFASDTFDGWRRLA